MLVRLLLLLSFGLFSIPFVLMGNTPSGVALVDSLAKVPFPGAQSHNKDVLIAQIDSLSLDNPMRGLHLGVYLIAHASSYNLSAKETSKIHAAVATILSTRFVDDSAINYLSSVPHDKNSDVYWLMKLHQGIYLGYQGDYLRADSILHAVANYYHDIDPKLQRRAHSAIAFNYMSMRHYDKAIEYYEKSFSSIDMENCNYSELVSIYSYTTTLYSQLPYRDKATTLSKIKEALRIYEKILQNCPFDRYQYGFDRIRYKYYMASDSLQKAEEVMRDIKAMIEQKPNFFAFYHYAHGYYNIASYYAHPDIAQYDQAIYYGQRSEEYFFKNNGVDIPHRYLNELYGLMLDVAMKKDDAALAKYYMHKLLRLSEDHLQRIQKSETQREQKSMELEMMELEEYSLRSNNQLLWLTCLIILTLIGVSLIIAWYIHKINQKNKNNVKKISVLTSSLQQQVALLNDKNNTLKESNKQLANDNQRRAKLINRLQDFSFVIMTDFKKPIRSVYTYSKILAQRLNDSIDDTEKDYLNYLENGSKRLNKMLDVVSQFNINNISLCQDLELLDLNDILHRVTGDLQDEFMEKKASVLVPYNLPKIYGAPQLVYQLFKVIIINSLQYQKTDVAPRINVLCKIEEDYHVIIIKDNGIGIKEDQIEDLLTFFRPMKGLPVDHIGVGLAMCKEIVDIHDGKLDISGEEGVGTTITIYFPINSNAENHTDIPHHELVD